MFRLSTRADPSFLAEMLYEAVYWRDDGAEERPSLEALLARPEHARFVEHWGRAGDLAVLALDRRDEPVGAAWCRHFDDVHVADAVVAVYPEFRGEGVGGLLVGSLVARASAGRPERLRIAMDADNPARRLLVRHGFEDSDTPGAMVRKLGESTEAG